MSTVSKKAKSACPDCDPSRRDFLKTTVGTVAAASAAAAGIITVTPRSLYAAPAAAASHPETLVSTLFKTLTDEQKKSIAFPFEHKLRSQVNANWHITEKPIKDLFNRDQQALIRDIFMGIHSPQYAD